MSKKEKKYRPTLVYESFMKELSAIREYGIAKYKHSEDWRTTKKIDHLDAALRHLFAYSSGDNNDEESGLHHVAHAATNLMFIIEANYTEAKQAKKYERNCKICGKSFMSTNKEAIYCDDVCENE